MTLHFPKLSGLLWSLLTIYAGLTIALYLLQDLLVFHPVTLTVPESEAVAKAHPDAIETTLKTIDGNVLRGWLHNPEPRKGIIIYFQGNAEEISYVMDQPPYPDGWGAALYNYRGYGLSEGKPSQAALESDALEIYDQTASRHPELAGRIGVMGRSLGCGPAVYLARHRPVAFAILTTPYDSVLSVARERYPVFPVSLILKHRFSADLDAPFVKSPALALVAEKDTVITPAHASALAEAWGGTIETVTISGATHNGIDSTPGYREAIETFLKSL